MAGHQRTGGHPGGRRTGEALYCGWAYMLTLWGKGGYGGSPNAEAGKGVPTNRYTFLTVTSATLIQGGRPGTAGSGWVELR
jgi:hypothetical protein